MSKWADYCIVAVKYGRDRSAIVEVKARPDSGSALGSEIRVPRARVVTAISTGTSFVTAHVRGGKYAKGEQVHVVQAGYESFIRTDANSVHADNLGNLPEYE